MKPLFVVIIAIVAIAAGIFAGIEIRKAKERKKLTASAGGKTATMTQAA